MFLFKLIEEEEADMTWVYILGGFIGANIILCIIFLYCRYRIQKKRELAEIEARQSGKIVQSWGIRTTNIDVREREIEKREASKGPLKDHSANTSHDMNS